MLGGNLFPANARRGKLKARAYLPFRAAEGSQSRAQQSSDRRTLSARRYAPRKTVPFRGKGRILPLSSVLRPRILWDIISPCSSARMKIQREGAGMSSCFFSDMARPIFLTPFLSKLMMRKSSFSFTAQTLPLPSFLCRTGVPMRSCDGD